MTSKYNPILWWPQKIFIKSSYPKNIYFSENPQKYWNSKFNPKKWPEPTYIWKNQSTSLGQGFESACWHREACRDMENTGCRWVSFDIKFTRQGFENARWHSEACRDIENPWMSVFDGNAWRTLVELRGLPTDSTCVLEAEPGKIEIKRRELGILCISSQVCSLFKLTIMT